MRHLLKELLLLTVIASPIAALSQEADQPLDDVFSDESLNQIKEMANVFAECAGYYQATAQYVGETSGSESMSEQLLGTARGAEVASRHYLELYWVGKFTQNMMGLSVDELNKMEPIDVEAQDSKFDSYVQSVALGTRGWSMSMIEQGLYTEQVIPKLELCAATSSHQAEIVQERRETALGL